jgi:hypothetical protein
MLLSLVAERLRLEKKATWTEIQTHVGGSDGPYERQKHLYLPL